MNIRQYWHVLCIAEKAQTNIVLKPEELREILEHIREFNLTLKDTIDNLNKIKDKGNE